MIPDQIAITDAATKLGDVLAAENAALAAFAFARSAAMAGDKERAIARFNQAASAQGTAGLATTIAERLGELVAENKRLLERALHVQGQVIACIARAAPRRHASARAYGRTGAWAGENRAMPIALAARV